VGDVYHSSRDCTDARHLRKVRSPARCSAIAKFIA
jgi:hypothetical protein